jgi:hypothetical protein
MADATDNKNDSENSILAAGPLGEVQDVTSLGAAANGSALSKPVPSWGGDDPFKPIQPLAKVTPTPTGTPVPVIGGTQGSWGGYTPSNPLPAATPPPAPSGDVGEGLVGGTGTVAPITGVNDPTASIIITNDSHPDSTDTTAVVDVQKVTVDNKGGMSVTQAYQAAGETSGEFLEDNTEYKIGDQIDKGRTFEIRNGGTEGQGNIQTLEKNVGGGVTIANPTPPLTGTQVGPTLATTASGTTTVSAPPPPPPPTVAALGPTTSAAAPSPTPSAAAVSLLPNAAVALSNNPHTDSTSNASVETVELTSGNTLVAKVAAAAGESAQTFVDDNNEYKTYGMVDTGHHFEIRTGNIPTLVSNVGSVAEANASGAFQSLKATGSALLRGAFLKKSKYDVAQSTDVSHPEHNVNANGGQAVPPASDPVASAVIDKPATKPTTSATQPRG